MLSNRQIKRACDHCHAVKEKCRRLDPKRPCERCARLSQKCETRRDITKTGRKSRFARRLAYTLPNATEAACISGYVDDLPLYNAGLGSNTAMLPGLDAWEMHFVNLMKDGEGSSPLDKFLVGPSFYQSHHVAFMQSIMKPTSPLKDAAVACAAVLFGDHEAEYAGTSMEIAYERAARAVSLRSCRISNATDLGTVLVLGMSLTTFAMHVAEGHPSLISHYILSLVEPQYERFLPPRSVLTDFLMCLICTETFECLLRSETPAMRVNTDGRSEVVDRYVGISYPIFPLLYDICQISSCMRTSPGVESHERADRLTELSSALEKWQPSPPPDLLRRFSQSEAVGILAQARILRLLGLLIIHRLQHPYGRKDHAASRVSQAIIAEFEMLLERTGRSVPCTALAYLAACFEIVDAESRGHAISRMPEIITFSRQSQIKFHARLIAVWNARDLDHSFCWFELGRYLCESK
ncbi:hypothetical protein N7468_000990 [Penicillium chermesinum]|uniref:Zn(2)-C6 fungal-type domain-containing protein n=1 Tax=Penicillium chermesinum TaxID=63820 RepID=A0A9W9TWL3_9EURO|nr:uncharacterized protein N7468_000990 [Penicillium chermesinum]KAJ5246007.1 hypothetical protein N7468_000990 [Penicillium chermesinum]